MYLRGDDTQSSTVNNYGGSEILSVGALSEAVKINALMRFTGLFDLSGETVVDATLRLYNYNFVNQTGDVTIDVYEVAAANGDWVEGTALGIVQTGSTDWRFKVQNTEEWAGGRNGCGVAGTDYVTNLVGRAVSIDTTAEWVEFTLGASVVQNWIDNPTQNHGLLLTAPGAVAGEIGYFRSSESASSGPELVVEVEGTHSEPPHFSVSSVFSDYMVLQRDQAVPIWGWASSGTVVNVTLDGVPAGTAVPDETGKWTAWIDAHPADGGQAHALLVSADGFDDVLIGNVVFGDVYLASGQSNMATLMRAFTNAASYPPDVNALYNEEIAAANHPLIRQLAIRAKASTNEWVEPAIRSPWETCSPATAPGFTAVGYFFSREVHLETGVPVGLLFSAWGGQKIDRFFSPSGPAAVPELSGMRQYEEQGGITNFYDIYNAMIAPLVPYGVRGAIWYQGEANAPDGDLYRYKMQALMRGWRTEWGQSDFSFDYVQLASYSTLADWPGLREAQRGALSEEDSGMAVTIDVGDDANIHPANKQDVGIRLAQWTLFRDLQQPVSYSGPLFYDCVVQGSEIRILFDHAERGLVI
ncbi:MAG: DNRLRE domain-containing protein, partial [Verrucomicrobiota bacterium]|nr:DNRLRE domain-containing protein [Verrucomicrobiota bacterium]